MSNPETNKLMLDWEFNDGGTEAYGVIPVFEHVCICAEEFCGGETNVRFTDDAIAQVFTLIGFHGGYYCGKSRKETLFLALLKLEEFLRKWLPEIMTDANEYLEMLRHDK